MARILRIQLLSSLDTVHDVRDFAIRVPAAGSCGMDTDDEAGGQEVAEYVSAFAANMAATGTEFSVRSEQVGQYVIASPDDRSLALHSGFTEYDEAAEDLHATISWIYEKLAQQAGFDGICPTLEQIIQGRGADDPRPTHAGKRWQILDRMTALV